MTALQPISSTTVFAARAGWRDPPAATENHIVEIKSLLILQPGPAALTDGIDAVIEAVSLMKEPA